MCHLGPVVADGVCEYLSGVVEGALGERLVEQLGALELGARVLVPEGEGAVGADGGERPVHGVEGDVVHRVDVLVAGGGAGGPVALEGEVVLGVGRVHVLDGDAALDAADREPDRLLALLVAEHGHAAVLVLQRGLHALELGRLALQAVQADAAVGRAHRRHRVILTIYIYSHLFSSILMYYQDYNDKQQQN